MKNNKINKALALAFSLSFFVALSVNNAKAGTNTASTKATATIAKACTLSATSINFGVLKLTSASNTVNLANGSIQMICTKSTSYSILMTYATPATKGNYMGGKPLTGLMTGANFGDIVAYSVQQQPINNSLPSWSYTPYNATGTGATQTITVYGEAQTNVFNVSAYPTPDNYSDSVTATVTY